MKQMRVGVDVGSTTIKLVIIDEAENILFHQYQRHFSDIPKAFSGILESARSVLSKSPFTIIITGSAGIGLADSLHLPFVQEVIACTAGIRKCLPSTNTSIELGGEDAKITYFYDNMEQRMNGVCAGGTGSFIDHMATLLNTDASGLNELAKKARTIHPIASRCGVFAKTDVQALMNDGVVKEDIAASILQAVVNQTIGSLAQGRPIKAPLAFLGGPLFFLSELRSLFLKTLNISEDQAIAPQSSPYFIALGAILAHPGLEINYDDLTTNLNTFNVSNVSINNLPPLFANTEEYEIFRSRHAAHKIKRADLATHIGPAYLGIDAGSTTTKLTLINSAGDLLYSDYGSNQGRPLVSAVTALQKMYSCFNKNTYIAYAGVTGYGEKMVQAALQADMSEVETVAHFRAAETFQPGVTFVIDIGGQDMKSFTVKDGVIDSIKLNEACSSGCGSFISNFSQSLGMTVEEFAKTALSSAHPVDLGTRCTVFMNSKVKQAQKEGATVGDISAGIAISVIKNALFKVIRIKNTEELGTKIVVQGGTFYNDAVLRALENLLQCEVVRPDIAGLMGAYGIALLAKEAAPDGVRSSILPSTELDNFSINRTNYRCAICGNHCLITSLKFSNGIKYQTGNRCERGLGKALPKNPVPNLYAYKLERVFAYQPLAEAEAPKGSIGIPRLLNMYEDYPFWFTFFTKLGYRVLLSNKSSRTLYEQGLETIPSDSLCYPAKMAHGHIIDLINQGVTKIFYPCIPYNIKEDMTADNSYNCPVVTSYSENIRANMKILSEKNIEYIEPFLPLDNPERLEKRLVDVLKNENIAHAEIALAAKCAYLELKNYKDDIHRQGEQVLEYIKRTKTPGIVLTGRPYHIDPEINHGLPELIQSFGLAILSEDSICHLAKTPRPIRVMDQWMYHSRLYAAASLVANRPDLELIQLNSFGCGLDAITMDQVKELLEANHKIYTAIKLDEINNLGAARIRIRSLLAALKVRNANNTAIIEENLHNHWPTFKKSMKKTHTILAPQMSPVHFQFLQAAIEGSGYQLVIPPMPDKRAVDLGLKFVNNDICYPSIMTIGQLLQALTSGQYDPEYTSVLLFESGGGCRATNYVALMRKALKDIGLPQVTVFSLCGKDSGEFRISIGTMDRLLMAITYGDLLMRVMQHVRPYELRPNSANELYEKWSAKCRYDLIKCNRWQFKKNILGIVRDFDNMPLKPQNAKPKVGLVGEILVKYHAIANGHIVQTLEEEGAEVIVPDLINFFLYTAYDDCVKYKLLAGSLANKIKSKIFIHIVEQYRKTLEKALHSSKNFNPPESLKELIALAKDHVSLGNITGEGWLLTAEMISLIKHGINNIICLQPFGCLPNHIVGKGMIRELLHSYPQANIVPIDCDAGASEVNQLNRIKLMLAVAFEKIKEHK